MEYTPWPSSLLISFPVLISKTGWVDMPRIISLGYLECFVSHGCAGWFKVLDRHATLEARAGYSKAQVTFSGLWLSMKTMCAKDKAVLNGWII